MKTEQALDLAYENPFICITTESFYEYGERFFYFDNKGNLKDHNGNIVTEDFIYETIEGSEDEEFNEWIEIEGEIPEDKDDNNEYDEYYYDNDDE